jgi:hypothetical protein
VNLASLYDAGWWTGETAPDPRILLAEWTGSSGTRLSGSSEVVLEWNGRPLYLDP